MIAVLACVAGAMLAPGCATAAWTFRALESNASGSYVDRMAMFAVGQASLRPWGHGNDAIQTAQGQIQRALVQDGTASSSGIMINISLHSAESAARRQLSILACLSDVLLVKAALRKVALERGGSVCLNSLNQFNKWFLPSAMPRPCPMVPRPSCFALALSLQSEAAFAGTLSSWNLPALSAFVQQRKLMPGHQ